MGGYQQRPVQRRALSQYNLVLASDSESVSSLGSTSTYTASGHSRTSEFSFGQEALSRWGVNYRKPSSCNNNNNNYNNNNDLLRGYGFRSNPHNSNNNKTNRRERRDSSSTTTTSDSSRVPRYQSCNREMRRRRDVVRGDRWRTDGAKDASVHKPQKVRGGGNNRPRAPRRQISKQKSEHTLLTESIRSFDYSTECTTDEERDKQFFTGGVGKKFANESTSKTAPKVPSRSSGTPRKEAPPKKKAEDVFSTSVNSSRRKKKNQEEQTTEEEERAIDVLYKTAAAATTTTTTKEPNEDFAPSTTTTAKGEQEKKDREGKGLDKASSHSKQSRVPTNRRRRTSLGHKSGKPKLPVNIARLAERPRQPRPIRRQNKPIDP